MKSLLSGELKKYYSVLLNECSVVPGRNPSSAPCWDELDCHLCPCNYRCFIHGYAAIFSVCVLEDFRCDPGIITKSQASSDSANG